MARTVEAVSQAIWTALTTPAFTYTKNNGSPITIPSTSIFSTPPYALKATAPDPMISFEVEGTGIYSLNLPDRALMLRIWAIATDGGDTVREIYEAARSRLVTGQDASSSSPLSRAATASTLAATIREIRDIGTMPTQFEKETQRFYLIGKFHIVAI